MTDSFQAPLLETAGNVEVAARLEAAARATEPNARRKRARGSFVSPAKTAVRPGLVDVYDLVAPFLSLQGLFAKIDVLTTVKFGDSFREVWRLPPRSPRASYECPWARGMPAFVTDGRVLLLGPMRCTADCRASTSPSGQEKDAYILSAEQGEVRRGRPGVYLSCARGRSRQLVGYIHCETVATLQSGGLLVSAETPLCSREWHKHHAEVRRRPLALQRAVALDDIAPARFSTDRQLSDMADNSEYGQRLFVADTTHEIAQSVVCMRASPAVVTVAVRAQAAYHSGSWDLERGEEEDDERRFIMKARQTVKSLIQAWARDLSPRRRPMCLPHALDWTGTVLDCDTCVDSLPRADWTGHIELILRPSWPPCSLRTMRPRV